MMMGGFDGPMRQRDDERDHERARNGVRGLRSGTFGFGSQAGGGAVHHSPEIMRLKETINPVHFDPNPKFARFYIIKSYSEDDVHKSIKYGVWASTDTGNRRLDAAYRETGAKGPIFLFFSVNASGQFSGMAQMESALDYTQRFGSWGQDKWNGTFRIKWTFVKDIPNNQFRHIVLANNENKPVTNSRDTQEVLPDQGREMLHIFHTHRSRTSILDDFAFYDKRQELMEARIAAQMASGGVPGIGSAEGGMGGPYSCSGLPGMAPPAPPGGLPGGFDASLMGFGGAAGMGGAHSMGFDSGAPMESGLGAAQLPDSFGGMVSMHGALQPNPMEPPPHGFLPPGFGAEAFPPAGGYAGLQPGGFPLLGAGARAK